MQRITALCVALCTIVLLGATAIAEAPKGAKTEAPKTAAAKPAGNETFAQVVLWDVAPGKTQAFEAAVREQFSHLPATADALNATLLKNLSELNSQYATYVRFQNAMTAEDNLAKQVAVLGQLCTRAPETHVIKVEVAYSPTGVTNTPTGTEFANGKTGQVAHLGLWVVDPSLQEGYETTLRGIKTGTMNQNNPGYLGEDLGDEVRTPSPEQQTPYSPHAKIASPMMINYGEFTTFQAAEESFMAHRNDPNIETEMQTFFGSLQVPTRFFIFQVVQSVVFPGHAARQNHVTPINEAKR